jgi:hypothetical protein
MDRQLALNQPCDVMYIDDYIKLPRRGIDAQGSASEYLLQEERNVESQAGGETETSTSSPCITPPSAHTNQSANHPNTRSFDTSKVTRVIGALQSCITVFEDISVASGISMPEVLDPSSYGEDCDEVYYHTLLDQNDRSGIYRGVVLRSNGMPHGSGMMVYKNKEFTYEGQWYEMILARHFWSSS